MRVLYHVVWFMMTVVKQIQILRFVFAFFSYQTEFACELKKTVFLLNKEKNRFHELKGSIVWGERYIFTRLPQANVKEGKGVTRSESHKLAFVLLTSSLSASVPKANLQKCDFFVVCGSFWFSRQRQTSESFDGRKPRCLLLLCCCSLTLWLLNADTQQKKSKSTSDILGDPATIRQARYEELQKYREKIKESEDQWQDDLSKWKNRRKSVNSDIVKKKEEREKIEEITYGSNRRSKTFKEIEEESSSHRENKGRSSVGSRLKSLSYLDDSDDVFDRPVIAPRTRTRTLPARSYTIDTPYYSPEPSEPSQIEKEPPAASPATGRAASPPISREVDVLDRPAGSDTTTTTNTVTPSSLYSSKLPAAAPTQKSPVSEYTRTPKTEETTATVSSSTSQHKVPEPRHTLPNRQTKVEAPSSGFLHKQQPQPSMEAKPPGELPEIG
ncbi:hypothetical protein INR49_030379 [Caranx melampygus]|nr:hypothetical protein INR49_030379 [Caranx melampygus]